MKEHIWHKLLENIDGLPSPDHVPNELYSHRGENVLFDSPHNSRKSWNKQAQHAYQVSVDLLPSEPPMCLHSESIVFRDADRKELKFEAPAPEWGVR